MKHIHLLIFFLYSTVMFSQSSEKITQEEYIEMYKDLAIKEAIRTGVPASITLSQGILESESGNSKLARKGKNHFGVKCHSSWTGKTIHKDDDTKNECFRRYKNVYNSYIDHSNFLAKGRRYAFLFEYKRSDYKAWAKGLKKAGYATNPKYPQLLINLIERHKLYQYDSDTKNITQKSNQKAKSEDIKGDKKTNQQNQRKKGKRLGKADVDNYSFSTGRKVYKNNSVKYIVVTKNDKISEIAKDYEMMEWEIFKYNDLPKTSKLVPNQKIYLQPKKSKAAKGNDYHITKEGDTYYTISQKYGVKLNKLYKKNNITKRGEIIKVGTKIWLRKRKPASKSI